MNIAKRHLKSNSISNNNSSSKNQTTSSNHSKCFQWTIAKLLFKLLLRVEWSVCVGVQRLNNSNNKPQQQQQATATIKAHCAHATCAGLMPISWIPVRYLRPRHNQYTCVCVCVCACWCMHVHVPASAVYERV